MNRRSIDARRLGECAAAWASTHRVLAAGRAVRYRAAGDGPPLVLVHGLGASADYWSRNAPALASAGLRVLAPDLPGFGRTPGPSGGVSVPEQARALAAWADSMRLGPAAYLGHSLSCQSVLELAARQPWRVRALVLAGPTGAPGARLPRQAWALARDAWREPVKLVTRLGWTYLQAGPRRFWQTWREGAEHDPLELLSSVCVPALVLVGTDDPVVQAEFARRLAAGLARGSLVWLEGASHAPHYTRAEAFNREVLRFLLNLPPTPRAARPPPRRAGGRGSRGGR